MKSYEVLAEIDEYWNLPIEEVYKYYETIEYMLVGKNKPAWFEEQYEVVNKAIVKAQNLQKITECSSEDGITIGLIDSILTSAKVLRSRNLDNPEVGEALKELVSSTELSYLLDQGNSWGSYG